jgi:hypothetical protein
VPGNPQVSQGVLNRLRASITFQDHSELNVTPPFLARGMIRFAREGAATAFIPTATGTVTSGEPFLMVTIGLELLKTQSLASAFESQLQDNSVLGKCTVRPDVSTGLAPFDVYNTAIETPGEMTFDGSSPVYPLTLRGYMLANNSLWP